MKRRRFIAEYSSKIRSFNGNQRILGAITAASSGHTYSMISYIVQASLRYVALFSVCACSNAAFHRCIVSSLSFFVIGNLSKEKTVSLIMLNFVLACMGNIGATPILLGSMSCRNALTALFCSLRYE